MKDVLIYNDVVQTLTAISVKNSSPSYEQKLAKLPYREVERVLYIHLQEVQASVSEFLEAYLHDGKIRRLKTPEARFYLALRCDAAQLWLYNLKIRPCPFCIKSGISQQEILRWLLVESWDLKTCSTVASIFASSLFEFS